MPVKPLENAPNDIQNIISSLFLCFNNNIGTFSNHQKRDILEIFEIVFNDINYIQYYGGNNNFMNDVVSGNHPIETLACTASAGSMKEHLIDLKNKLELVLGVLI